MRLPGPRGLVVPLGLATAALWLTAAAAQAQGLPSGASLPHVVAPAAKSAAPVVSQAADASKSIAKAAAQASAAATTPVSNAVKSVPVPSRSASQGQPSSQKSSASGAPAPTKGATAIAHEAETIIEDATAPVVEAVAPAVDQLVEAIAPSVDPILESVATSVEPIVETATPSVHRIVETVTLPEDPIVETVTLPEDPIVETVAPPDDPIVEIVAQSVDRQSVDVPMIEAQPSSDDDSVTVTPLDMPPSDSPSLGSLAAVDEPKLVNRQPRNSLVTTPSLPSVTPLVDVVAIHDAELPRLDEPETNVSSPVQPVSSSEVAQASVGRIVPSTADLVSFGVPIWPSKPSNGLVSSPMLIELELAAQPEQKTSPTVPRLPVSSGASPPATAPANLLLSSPGAPGAAPPVLGPLRLTAMWRVLWQLGRLQPTSIALSSLAPPG
jgi:hypothetical protein